MYYPGPQDSWLKRSLFLEKSHFVFIRVSYTVFCVFFGLIQCVFFVVSVVVFSVFVYHLMLQILPSPPPPTSHRCLCLMQNPICHLAHDWMNWNAFQTNCQKFQKIRPNLAQGQFQGKYRIQKIQNAEHPASSILCSMQPLTLFQEVLVCAEIDASLACFRIGSPQPFYTRPHTAIPFKSSFLSHFQYLITAWFDENCCQFEAHFQ